VRFAGRRRGIPDWAITQTVDAIACWTQEMLDRANDPDASGPGKQFLLAGQEGGAGLADEEAVASFIAGWNARSEAG
jgi:hypothetical protein